LVHQQFVLEGHHGVAVLSVALDCKVTQVGLAIEAGNEGINFLITVLA
jgi:hypothetical protein